MNGLQLLASWLTPAVLFCILNLMIGTIFVVSTLRPRNKQSNMGDHENADESPQKLVRVPSLFERVNSIKFSLYRFEQHGPVSSSAHLHVPNQEQAQENSQANHKESQVTRSKSDTRAQGPSSTVTVIRKTASEKVSAAEQEDRQQRDQEIMTSENTEASGGGDDEAVDARADDFISRFRQQLKLQRLDSLLRYKEMLKQGGSR